MTIRNKLLGLTAVAIVLLLAAVSTAGAYNCTTTCYGSGSFRTCNTSCF